MSGDVARSVLFVAGKSPGRTAAVQVASLARGLGKRGWQTSFLCRDSRTAQEFQRAGVPGKTHRAVRIETGLAGLRAYAASSEADVIHVCGRRIGHVGRRLIRLAGAPCVLTVHPPVDDTRDLRWLHPRMKRLIAVSEAVRAYLVNTVRVPKDKIAVIPDGVDLATCPARFPREDSECPVVGTVGPLGLEQGQRYFVEAAARLVEAGVRARFVLGGDGPEERALRRLARARGLDPHLTFVNRVVDYSSIVSTLDVYVAPLVSEGGVFTLLEAMAIGKAVVATNVGTTYKVVQDGETGFLVPKADATALADRLERLARQPSELRRVGRCAREFVRKNFALDQTVERVEALYREVLHGG